MAELKTDSNVVEFVDPQILFHIPDDSKLLQLLWRVIEKHLILWRIIWHNFTPRGTTKGNLFCIVLKETYTRIVIAALFTVPKTWKRSRGPSTGKQNIIQQKEQKS